MDGLYLSLSLIFLAFLSTDRLDPTGKMLDVVVPATRQQRRDDDYITPSPCSANKAVSQHVVLVGVVLSL